jgi:hypothetical protein
VKPALVQVRRVPCGGRIVPEVDSSTTGFALATGYRVRCKACGHAYHVAAGVLANGVCVRVRREKV